MSNRQNLSDDGSRNSQEALTDVSTLLGRKWHLVILASLFDAGPQGFSALQRRIDGISSKVLSESLQDLERRGLVDRRVVSDKPFRVEYSLTDRGRDLRPFVEAARLPTVDAETGRPDA